VVALLQHNIYIIMIFVLFIFPFLCIQKNGITKKRGWKDYIYNVYIVYSHIIIFPLESSYLNIRLSLTVNMYIILFSKN